MKAARVSVLAGLLLLAPFGQAADHLDAPLVQADGRLDLNDVYLFQSPQNANNVVMVMTVNPVAGLMSPTTFHPVGIYEFRVSNDTDPETEITFEITFGTPNSDDVQSVVLRRNGVLAARGNTGQNILVRSSGGGMLRADLFDDPFFFDLLGFRNGLMFTGDDFFAGLNTSAIVLEIPRSTLGSNNIGVWARTEIDGSQFDRTGLPALNTVFIPASMKDAFNAGDPVNDRAAFGDIFRNFIVGLGRTAEDAAAITNVLLPDIMPIDTSSADGFLNGRRLADDVIDIELQVLTGNSAAGDGVDANDKDFLNTFPYLASPN